MKSLIASSLSALAASALFLAAGSTSANAADYTWDTVSGDGATITAGNGAWSTTGTNWNNGGSNFVWSQTTSSTASHNAIFSGTDGTYTVTLGGTATNAGAVTFNNGGYTLTSGTLTLKPTGTTNGNITVAAGKTATISSPIAFSNNAATTITSGSGATLNLGGGASNSQYTFTGLGTVNMTSGTYQANVGKVNVATFNQTSGTFSMQPNGLNTGYSIGENATRSVAYTMSGSSIINFNGQATGTNSFLAIGRSSGTTAYANTLNVTGAANLNVGTTAARSGELQIGSTADSNGTLNVTGGAATVGTGTTNNKIYFFKNGSNAGYSANLTQSGGTVTANGIQFGGTAGTYSGTSSANLTVSGGVLYVGLQGITRGSGASALPVTIKLQGGAIGASDNWSSSLDMKLGTTSGGPTFQAATSGGVSKNITLSGVLSDDDSVNGKLTKTGAGTLTLSGSNTFTGATTINAGTLALGANNVLADTTNVTIAAATLNAATYADTAGTLDPTAASSTINLGSGATLAFADSSTVDWTGGTLNITGNNFVPGEGGSLRFGTTSGGLTAAQLGKIIIEGYSNFILNENGYLTTGDSTPPTLTSIVDNRGGGSITEGTTVTYTVTFSEAINAATISAADFSNAGTAGCTIGTVSQVSTTVFTVPITNATAGTLILQIPVGASINDAIGNSLVTTSAIPDDTTITVNTSPLPTLSATNIVDDKAGEPVAPNMMVTYTVTFNEDIDAATVSSADFGNAGTSTVTFGTVTETSPTSGVFTVQVTPTSTGTLQLKVNAGAVIKAAVSGNVLDTISAIVDADTITVGSYLFWDTGSSDGATITSGDGAWNTSAGNAAWNNLTTNVPWSQTSATDASNGAVFGGADGAANEHVVTVGGTMAAESLTFNSSGYQITSGTVALMPTTTTNGNITVAAGKTATISSPILYADNKAATITANSGATLNLGGGATNSQYSFTGAGIVNMNAGTYSADVGKVNVATFNQGGGTFNMTLPAATNGQYAIGFTAGRSVTYTLSGNATINANGNNASDAEAFLAIGRSANNTAYNNILNVTGSATLNVGTATRAGELLIASNANSNGTLNVTSGTVLVSGTANNKIYFFKNGSNPGYSANLTQSGGRITANGIQFGGTATNYDGTSSANLTLSGSTAELYVGSGGITSGSGAGTLPVAIKLEGGTLGANQNWSSSLNMQLGATAGGVTIRAQDATTNGRTITLSGNLSDVSGVNGTLTKAGTSDLTLSGSNSYSGGTTVNAGRLFINSANALPSTGAVTVNAGTLALNASGTAAFDQGITLNTGSNLVMRQAATLSNVTLPTTGIVTFNQDGEATQAFSLGSNVGLTGNLNIQVGGGLGAPGNITLTGAISGTNTLTKSGTGTLTLSGSNTYTGATVVSAGTLDLGATDAASSSSSLTVNSGAGLALSSSSSTVPNLTFAGTGTLSFDVASNRILTVNDTDGVTNSGAVGSITINITGDAPAVGTYTLIDYSGTLQGTNGFNAYTLGSAPLGKSYALNNNSVSGAVELVVTSVYNWTGANGSEWSTASGLNNWSKDGGAIDYANDLAVIFENTATNQIVNITGADVTPLSVLFNSGTYTLGGSFKIGGSAPVTVASGATLKLGSSNVLPDGAGAGNVTINGTLDLNGNSDTVNALTGSGSIDNTAAATTSTLTVGANTGGTFSGSLKNTGGTLALTKTGANDVILTGSNSYNGATTINQGRLFISSTNAFSPNTAVTVNNGASFFLNAAGTYAQSITLNSGASLAQRTAATLSNVTLPSSGSVIFNNDTLATQAFTLANAQTLGGSLNIQVGGSGTAATGAVTLSGTLSGSGGSLVKSGTGQLILRGANTFGGGVTIQNGTLESQATQTTLGTGTVTMGGTSSTGATYLTGQGNANPFVINAPASGAIVIGANGAGSGFTMSGGVSLNGNLTLQTFNNTAPIAPATTKATAILTGGVTGSGNLLLNNNGLAANNITISGSSVNHTGSITLQGTATGDTAISAPIGANVTGITQSSTTSRLVLSGSNSYASNLTINAGTVQITNKSNIANDVSTVTIATGGILDLTYVGTDKVDKLVIGGVEQPAGVYGKSGSTDPSVTNTSAQITGDGTLTVGAPEIALEQPANTAIASGGSQDFGSVEVGSNTSLTFTIRNSGDLALNLTGTPAVAISGANAADFTVTANPTTPVAAGGTTTFTVQFAPSAASASAATLTIANDDSDEGSYVISLSGTGTDTAAPEIAVEQPADTEIVSGGSKGFGSVALGSNSELTFTVRNSGNAALSLSGTPLVAVGGTHAADFTVTADPTTPVSAAGTTTFTVRFAPSALGERSADLTIANNDNDEGSYVINLTGTGTGAPEIAVEQPANTGIASGGSKGFGTVTLGSNNELTFTIRNSGNIALSLSGTPLVAVGGTHAADFTVTADPTTPVSAAGTTTFTVRFTPGAAGARSAALTIANNDSDEGSYVINLTGTGQTAFDAWAGGATFNADANGDGVSNGLAWILGAADVSTNARSLLPTVSSSGTNMVVTFKRIQASINANTALTIELGTTLSAWPTTYTVGTDTAGSTSGVTIVKDSPSAGTDTVTLTVARGADAKKFVRLKAVLTP